MWLVLAGTLALPAPLALLSSSGCDDDPRGPRLGAAGDSCLITNDCAAPLSCIDNVCGGKADGGAGGGGEGGGGTGGGPPTPDAGQWSACDKCLDTECAAELSACGEDCIAIEACIETVCKHLGEVSTDEESTCFVNCQSQHPKGKKAHIAVVDCSQSKSCFPPCVPYPQNFEDCRAYMEGDLCAASLAACEGSSDCKNYRECVSVCSTAADCIACDDTPEGQAGRELLEAHERCIASECVSESWLPQSL